MNVALYLRRSTNERLQAESLRVQEELLRRYAKQRGHRVVAVYRDSASGTTTKRRAAFLAMVDEIANRPPYTAVLVRDVTRFGRFYDVDEAAFYEILFLGHGVSTIYSEEVFENDRTPMAGLLKNIKRVMAAEFSRDKSRLTKAGKARARALGYHDGGPPPYGFVRALVDRKGRVDRQLARGQWKATSQFRTVLAPGPQEAVAAVRRIFATYDRGRTLLQIASALERARVRPPLGKRWNLPTIARILDDERYASSGRVPGSDPIVSRDLWERVRLRRASATRRQSNDSVAESARVAYVKHGSVGKAMFRSLPRPVCRGTLVNRFGSVDGALAHGYRIEVAAAKKSSGELLRMIGAAEDDEGWKIGPLSIAFRPAFLHENDRHSTWFIRPGELSRDLILSVGIRPSGDRTSYYLLVRSWNSLGSRHIRAMGNHRMLPSDLLRRLRILSRSSLPGVEQAFIESARSQQLLNLRKVARELGWPHHAAVRTYHRLKKRGVSLPLLWRAPGNRIAVVCPRCRKRRVLAASNARALVSDVCRRCYRRRGSKRILVQCPVCGAKRKKQPWEFARLKNGAATVCRPCTMRANRGSGRSTR